MYRDMLYILLKGPGTVKFFSLCRAEFKAMVTKEWGQTQYEGYTTTNVSYIPFLQDKGRPSKWKKSQLTDELPRQPCKPVSNEVRRQRNQNLIAKAPCILLIEVLRQHLRPDDVLCIRQTLRGIRHNRNKHVLLLVEPSWVEIVRLSQQVELPRGHPLLPRFAQGKRKQLRNIGADGDGGLADAEELIDKGQKDGQDDANDPAAHCRARGGRVIFVVHHSTDFGVGAVVGDQGGFELHLQDEGFVFLGVREDVFVAEEGLDALDDDVWEIGVPLVDTKHIGH